MGIRRPIRYLMWRLRPLRPVAQQVDNQTVFSKIFKENLWGNDESVSGPGSTLAFTANLRSKLTVLIKEFAIRDFVDAPCGDFNWMGEVVRDTDINYTGLDVVPDLIEQNRSRYGDLERVNFEVTDITRDQLPKADIIMCRDCLFHLSWADTAGFVDQFLRSGTPYLLTTHHHMHSGYQNTDIVTGGYRDIDLFKQPYSFPRAVKHDIDYGMDTRVRGSMLLWHRDQIKKAMQRKKGLQQFLRAGSADVPSGTSPEDC